MPHLELARCTLTIETTPVIHHYGWVARSVSTFYRLPFRSPAERERYVRQIAAYVGPVVAIDKIEDVAALLCFYQCDDEAASQLAARCLGTNYTALLTLTPLAEISEIVDLLLAEATAAVEAK